MRKESQNFDIRQQIVKIQQKIQGEKPNFESKSEDFRTKSQNYKIMSLLRGEILKFEFKS